MRGWIGWVGIALTLACGVKPLADEGTPAPDDAADCALSERNAYGMCYPTEDIGIAARDANTSMLDSASLLAEYYRTMVRDPATLIIDARSMEILSASIGFDVNENKTLIALAEKTRASQPRP